MILCYLSIKKYLDEIEFIKKSLESPVEQKASYKLLRRFSLEMRELFQKINEYRMHEMDSQEVLRADRKMFFSILRNMKDGILIVNHEGVVSMINESACSLFQTTQQEAKNRTLIEVIRDFRINNLFTQCVESGEQQILGFESKPGKNYFQVIATPMNPEIPGGVLFLFQDLTRLRQLEHIRRDFVSNVSHELRTPLTSLKLITETLQGGVIEDPAAAQHFIERMDGEVDTLTQLVEELLELSRIESGRVPLEKHNINANEVINSAINRMALQANRARLILKNTSTINNASIFADPTRLEQVLINLIHNAIKFTPPGGKIEVAVSQKNSKTVFSVQDNGKGIPSKDLERIFERFYKIDPSRSEHGTGLGLSISRHLVELHGGEIWAESQVGKGSTFFFQIPIE